MKYELTVRDFYQTEISPPEEMERLTERGSISRVKEEPPLNLCGSSKLHRHSGGDGQ